MVRTVAPPTSRITSSSAPGSPAFQLAGMCQKPSALGNHETTAPREGPAGATASAAASASVDTPLEKPRETTLR